MSCASDRAFHPSAIFLALSSAAACLVREPAAQSDWPLYQADAAHAGYVPVDPNPGSMSQRWRVQLTTGTLNPISAAGGKVFVTSPVYFQSGSLWALDASTGAIAWTSALGAPFSINPPSYANGRVYVQTCNHSNDTYLKCFDAATGQLRFATNFAAQWEQYMSPTVVDGIVYINGGYYGGMYAFDGTSGQQRWFAGLPQYDEWTPAVDATYCYAYMDGYLFAQSRVDGARAFSIRDLSWSWSGWSSRGAVMLGDQQDAFVINAGRLIRFDLAGRTMRYEIAGNFLGQPALRSGVVYAASSDALTALDQGTGAVLWRWPSSGATLQGDVVLTRNHAFVHGATSTHMIDLASHAQVWSRAEGGYLAVGSGALFIAQGNGWLTCVGYSALPAPVGIAPARSPYGRPAPPVTITGSGFMQGTDLAVRFGSALAQSVVVVDDQTITCSPPANGPGVVDVHVENSIGRGTLPGGYAFTPAMTAPATAQRGGTVTLGYRCTPGDAIVALRGPPPARPCATPPFRGERSIYPNFVLLFLVPSWPFDQFRTVLDVPNDPSLNGATFLAQALVGSGMVTPPLSGAWTNLVQFSVQ